MQFLKLLSKIVTFRLEGLLEAGAELANDGNMQAFIASPGATSENKTQAVAEVFKANF